MPWITVGTTEVLQQQDAQSCGYCCIGMALHRVHGRRDTESSIVATGARLEGGAYDRRTGDRVGLVATPLVAAAAAQGDLEHWGSGTYGNHLARVLTEGYNLQATYHGGRSTAQMKAAMRSVSADQSMIALVLWNGGGGGHWVLVTGRATRGWGSASDYTILDPAGEVTVNRGSTAYTSSGGAGTFAGYYVMVGTRQVVTGQTARVKVM